MRNGTNSSRKGSGKPKDCYETINGTSSKRNSSFQGLLLVALLGSALGDGIPDDVEVVTSTSVSVRVSTSEDHVPRESIINQIVNKDEDKGDVSMLPGNG